MDIVTYALLNGKIKNYASNVDEWLEENVDPATGYVLDRSLQMENAAAPADMVGNINDEVGDLRNTLSSVETAINSNHAFYNANTASLTESNRTAAMDYLLLNVFDKIGSTTALVRYESGYYSTYIYFGNTTASGYYILEMNASLSDKIILWQKAYSNNTWSKMFTIS